MGPILQHKLGAHPKRITHRSAIASCGSELPVRELVAQFSGEQGMGSALNPHCVQVYATGGVDVHQNAYRALDICGAE